MLQCVAVDKLFPPAAKERDASRKQITRETGWATARVDPASSSICDDSNARPLPPVSRDLSGLDERTVRVKLGTQGLVSSCFIASGKLLSRTV
ncbi:MAG TPA: hypothetical protein VF797_01145 [Noviherbaspirillum sp.]